MHSLQIWYTWVDLEHQVSVGISERTPRSSSYRCQTYAGLVLQMWISYFSSTPNLSLSKITSEIEGALLLKLWYILLLFWFPISHHHRTPGETVGAIMERNLGEESTITNVSGLTLATRWHRIRSYKSRFWDYYPKEIKRGWKEKCRIIKLENHNEKITLYFHNFQDLDAFWQ